MPQDLVHGIVAADVLTKHLPGPVRLKEPGGMNAPRAGKDALCGQQPIGQVGQECAGDLESGRQNGATGRLHGIDRRLTTDAATR